MILQTLHYVHLKEVHSREQEHLQQMLFHQMNIWLYEVSASRSPRISDFYWEHIPKSDHQNNEEQNHEQFSMLATK